MTGLSGIRCALSTKRRSWAASRALAALSILAIWLAGCRGAGGQVTPTQLDPGVVLTAAASTASARMTAQAAAQPSPTASQTPTLSPTSITPTVTLTIAPLSPTLTLTITGGTDLAEFVTDVTVPDGSVFRPGEAFTKTWRLKNVGTSTWTPAYALVFVSGTAMSNTTTVPLPNDVPPGQTVDLSINLTAPDEPGNYFGFWMLRSPSQRNFGVGPGDQPFYVEINVQGGSGSPAPTSPPVSGGVIVRDVSIAVDQAAFEGDCPHTFNFIARFSLARAATVSYRLEAETGFPLTLPEPVTTALDAGTYTLSYALEFSGSLNGWARLHITAPEDVASNQVSFSLRCR